LTASEVNERADGQLPLLVFCGTAIARNRCMKRRSPVQVSVEHPMIDTFERVLGMGVVVDSLGSGIRWRRYEDSGELLGIDASVATQPLWSFEEPQSGWD
jgi:hypothetical protein